MKGVKFNKKKDLALKKTMENILNKAKSKSRSKCIFIF